MTEPQWLVEQQRQHNLNTYRHMDADFGRSPMEIALSVLDAKPHLIGQWTNWEKTK